MDVEIPDITAMYLEEAMEILEASGIHVREITKTQPPRQRDGTGNKFRVILVNRLNEKEVSLTVTAAYDVDSFFSE